MEYILNLFFRWAKAAQGRLFPFLFSHQSFILKTPEEHSKKHVDVLMSMPSGQAVAELPEEDMNSLPSLTTKSAQVLHKLWTRRHASQHSSPSKTAT